MSCLHDMDTQDLFDWRRRFEWEIARARVYHPNGKQHIDACYERLRAIEQEIAERRIH
jgi:hypothetical protein